jgi:hypothetical protein
MYVQIYSNNKNKPLISSIFNFRLYQRQDSLDLLFQGNMMIGFGGHAGENKKQEVVFESI